ncbi:DUF2480 family protein [Urechidicola vernalis]|uniref:DUF2480 family protein n=1 Tax=Urechidicola vernalis TaxID=3075600 RepID=A0ABU2Y7N1_9FLAO|nr:DUF2480 family protein [Urechidicola sp. P050]MDT0554191.1 DUF2480 family protein [Urechidicola sp. P050]
MMSEIRNKVTESSLITIDLEEYYPEGKRVVFDIKDWLFEELILKEKDFRAYVKSHDWSQYKNSYVALTCSADAIIPSWAYLLITSNLSRYSPLVVVGDLIQLETSIFQNVISNLPIEQFTGKPVIIKGCSNKPIPDSAYTLLMSRLTHVARSIMFGEACSTVPLFKAKK